MNNFFLVIKYIEAMKKIRGGGSEGMRARRWGGGSIGWKNNFTKGLIKYMLKLRGKNNKKNKGDKNG